MNIHRYLTVIGAVCLPVVALAQGAAPDPRNGPSTPVQVMNGPNNPVPVDGLISGEVEIINTEPIKVTVVPQSAAPSTVICTRDAGSAAGSDSPFRGIGFIAPLTAGIQCPAGVQKIDVKRIGFTPDVGASSGSNVAAFRVTVGVQQSGQGFPGDPGGIVAVVTDGTPLAGVAQDFVLDTTDATRSIYVHVTVSSGIATTSATLGGTLLFAGTPVD